jgi:peptidoglycan/LPS O-acetylase OafA/YrhL
MPALFTMIVAFEVLSFIFPDAVYHANRKAGIVALFYVMDFARSNFNYAGGIFGHTWSLSVEEQFYLVWPLILMVCLRRGGPRLLLKVTAVLCVLPTIERSLLLLAGASSTEIYNRPDTRADQLLLGCLFATALWVWKENEQILQRLAKVSSYSVWIGVAAFAALFPTLQENLLTGSGKDVLYSVGFLGIAVAALLIIACAVLCPDHPLSRFLAWRPLAWFGFRLSYGLYLWHFPVILVITNLHLRRGGMPLEVGLSLVGALLSFAIIERPFNQRKRHFAAVQTDRQDGTATPE